MKPQVAQFVPLLAHLVQEVVREGNARYVQGLESPADRQDFGEVVRADPSDVSFSIRDVFKGVGGGVGGGVGVGVERGRESSGVRRR